MIRYLFQNIILFVLWCIPFLSMAFQLDWQGHYIAQGVYLYETHEKNSGNSPSRLYGEHSLSLKSKALISDGLVLNSHFAFAPIEEGDQQVSTFKRKGFLQLDSLTQTRLDVTHVYGSYTGEFFQVQFGRQPISFGLGMTYSDGSHYAEKYYSVRDALSLEIHIGQIFVKPYLATVFNDSRVQKLETILHAGYKAQDFGAEVFYAKGNVLNRKDTEQTANVYGYYQLDDLSLSAEWGAKGSFSSMKQMASMGAVAKANWKTPIPSSSVYLSAGYVGEQYLLHPNHNATFILWDYYFLTMGQSMENHPPNITDCFLATVGSSVALLKHYELEMAYSWFPKRHELMLMASYKSKKGFVWSNIIGVASNEQLTSMPFFGAVTRAVVYF